MRTKCRIKKTRLLDFRSEIVALIVNLATSRSVADHLIRVIRFMRGLDLRCLRDLLFQF